MNFQLRLSEAASPRLQLGRKNLPPSDYCPDYEFDIIVGVWEVRQVKPGNCQNDKAHSYTCMCAQCICHTDFKIEQQVCFLSQYQHVFASRKNASISQATEKLDRSLRERETESIIPLKSFGFNDTVIFVSDLGFMTTGDSHHIARLWNIRTSLLPND